ncbi:MAG: uroporphyrinogen decarboxylase family protein [Armatimonadota bacterium]|nr:uroporphyrinogen decarboxylase family protein [Armatimonadota bacterium]
MTPKEKILAVFSGKGSPEMPWFADLTYWYNAQAMRGLLPEKYHGNGVVQLYNDMGCGCHEHALNLPCEVRYEDVETVQRYENDADGKPYLQFTEWRTPVGTLSQVHQFEPLGCCWAYREYPVKTVSDLNILRFVYEHQIVTPNYEVQRRQLDLWGDIGTPASIPPRSPMAQLLVIWAGVQNTVYAMADDIVEVEKTLEVLGASDDPIYDAIENSPATMVYFGENITSEVVTPTIFNKYYAPYYKKRVPRLHKAGKYIFVHVDGTVRGVLPLLEATGVDCGQSLTPYPVGDATVAKMRELAGPNLILWSGVPGALFSPVYTEEPLRQVVAECIEEFRRNGRFIMGICDQLPPDGLLERVRLVTELIAEAGL